MSVAGRRPWLLSTFLLLLTALAMPQESIQAECCSGCGCQAGCQKICRLVKEEKKVEITCWGCKCEDFCLGRPSQPGCEHCEMVCNECQQEGVDCVEPKRFLWTAWIPNRCADQFSRKKLMKRTVTKKVPSFKWVIEDRCPACQASCEVVTVEAGAPLPPLPDTDVHVIRNVSYLPATPSVDAP